MRKRIMMDVNLLPELYSKDTTGAKKYGDDFKIGVIPFNASKTNMRGGIANTPSIIVL